MAPRWGPGLAMAPETARSQCLTVAYDQPGPSSCFFLHVWPFAWSGVEHLAVRLLDLVPANMFLMRLIALMLPHLRARTFGMSARSHPAGRAPHHPTGTLMATPTCLRRGPIR